MMISTPPTRATQLRAWKATWPSALADAPSRRKMIVNPVMKSSEWMTAVRRCCCTSSRLMPVMNVM